jgi:8-oxo-dGTP diphosphatase
MVEVGDFPHASSAMDGMSAESASKPPARIGVAVVVWRGRYLVGRRPDGGALAGYDEFPGGKCHAGETQAACAVRECREETGLEVFAVDLLMHRTFVYPHGAVDLQFWLCRPSPRVGDDVPVDCRGYVWKSATELAECRFPEANAPLLDLLTERHSREHP